MFSYSEVIPVLAILALIFLAFIGCGAWYMCCKKNPHEVNGPGFSVAAASNRLFKVNCYPLYYTHIYFNTEATYINAKHVLHK